MAKKSKPIDNVFTNPPQWGNPHKYRSKLLSGLFLKNKEAFEDYKTFWDKAFARGVTFPAVHAMIEFRNSWVKNSEGQWVRGFAVQR